ncbi:MAG: glycosyltransferase [Candidatus Promineifilaceae bacterium]
MFFSIVVCTYNRARYVQAYLPTALTQAFDPTCYEVIVVDNNSSDNTRPVVEQLQTQHPHLRYCFEPKQGLSHARNAGWRAANGRYIAYLDDECRVAGDWLTRAATIVDQYAPVVFGGDVGAFYESQRPRWWREAYSADFCHTYGAPARWLSDGKCVVGGNMFVQREALEHVNGFDPNFGMHGDTVHFGEEDDLVARLSNHHQMPFVYYDSELSVSHLVRPEKLTILRRYRTQIARSYAWMMINQQQPAHFSRRTAALFYLYLCKTAVTETLNAIFLRDKTKYPHWQNYLYQSKLLIEGSHHLGLLKAQRSRSNWA